jgi:hypothetical protein
VAIISRHPARGYRSPLSTPVIPRRRRSLKSLYDEQRPLHVSPEAWAAVLESFVIELAHRRIGELPGVSTAA